MVRSRQALGYRYTCWAYGLPADTGEQSGVAPKEHYRRLQRHPQELGARAQTLTHTDRQWSIHSQHQQHSLQSRYTQSALWKEKSCNLIAAFFFIAFYNVLFPSNRTNTLFVGQHRVRSAPQGIHRHWDDRNLQPSCLPLSPLAHCSNSMKQREWGLPFTPIQS